VIQLLLLQRKSSSIEAVLESLSVFPGRQCSYYIYTMVSFVRIVTRYPVLLNLEWSVDRLKCEIRFRLSAKRTSPFKSAGASVQSTTGSRGVRIGGSNAGYTMFRGSVKSTGYPIHSPVSPSLPLPCVTVCHHISTGL
jgi:hypothetical protein